MSFNAQLALSQLTNAANPTARLKIMIGGKDFIKSDSEQWVAFKFPNGKYNYCKIQLNGYDLYDMTFQKWVWSKGKLTKEVVINDLYYDQLKNVFEQETGLYLSL